MLLARLIVERPTELRADLQRYYGLNLDDMGVRFSALHAGACASCLPLGSAVLASYDPKARWTKTDYRLHEIVCLLAHERIPFPWDDEADGGQDDAEYRAVPLEEFKRIYEETDWRPDGIEYRI